MRKRQVAPQDNLEVTLPEGDIELTVQMTFKIPFTRFYGTKPLQYYGRSVKDVKDLQTFLFARIWSQACNDRLDGLENGKLVEFKATDGQIEAFQAYLNEYETLETIEQNKSKQKKIDALKQELQSLEKE